MMHASAIAAAVLEGRTSAVRAVQDALNRIETAIDLNLVTEALTGRALRHAATVDRAVAQGEDLPLAGVPFVAKDLFDVEGHPTRAGSKVNRDLPPAEEDATAIRRLEAAGAVLIATTTMDEYAYGYTSENAHNGPARNPHDQTRTPGGSSGGSAGTVGGGLVPLALGSDTNGSIRVPAALSGCFGLKPTFGRLSRHGTFPFVASLDHVGPFAATTHDLALAYDLMQGPDPRDPACAGRAVAPVRDGLDDDAPLRVARVGGYFEGPLDADARAALERAAALLGAEDEVALPEPERARAAGFVITTSEAGNLHGRTLRTRPFDLDPLIRDRLLAGALIPGQWYLAAQRFRRWFADALKPLFARHDVLLMPAVPCAAPKVGADIVTVEGQNLPARLALGLYVQPLTIAGLPIAVAPCFGASGLPTGVQLMAAAGREDLVLRAAAALERQGYAAPPDAKATHHA